MNETVITTVFNLENKQSQRPRNVTYKNIFIYLMIKKCFYSEFLALINYEIMIILKNCTINHNYFICLRLHLRSYLFLHAKSDCSVKINHLAQGAMTITIILFV